MDALIFLALWSGLTALLAVIGGRRSRRAWAGRFRLYFIAGWALVSVGALQVLFTPLRFRELSESAVWFCATGFLVIFTGALNLLNLENQAGQASLRRVCTLANGVVTVLFVAVATHRGAEPLHDPVSGAMILAGLLALGLGLFLGPEKSWRTG
jgi:hypothetical protein